MQFSGEAFECQPDGKCHDQPAAYTNLLGIKAEEAQKTLSHEQFSALCQALAASPVLLPVEIAYYTGCG